MIEKSNEITARKENGLPTPENKNTINHFQLKLESVKVGKSRFMLIQKS